MAALYAIEQGCLLRFVAARQGCHRQAPDSSFWHYADVTSAYLDLASSPDCDQQQLLPLTLLCCRVAAAAVMAAAAAAAKGVSAAAQAVDP